MTCWNHTEVLENIHEELLRGMRTLHYILKSVWNYARSDVSWFHAGVWIIGITYGSNFEVFKVITLTINMGEIGISKVMCEDDSISQNLIHTFFCKELKIMSIDVCRYWRSLGMIKTIVFSQWCLKVEKSRVWTAKVASRHSIRNIDLPREMDWISFVIAVNSFPRPWHAETIQKS